jgi:propionyl-CoA synthetase
LRGATTILYEGKPNTPNPGIFWSLIEKHKVKGFYTAPTAVRFLRKEDPNSEWMKKYDLSSLKIISMAGERCDIPTF